MKIFSIFLLMASPAASEPAPLTDQQQRDLACVAALAIVASEQERGDSNALGYPLLAERGEIYAGLVGERVMAETGKSREQVRTDILAAVEAQQAGAASAADINAALAEEMALCLPLLDAVVPPKPKPDLTQCAGMMQLAYEEVHKREGLSKTAQDLKTLAAVLDNRARQKLRADGMSGNESDILLTQSREAMLADAKRKQAAGMGADLDFEHCFVLAAPEDKERKYEH